jgi:AbiV family abortive infection protein
MTSDPLPAGFLEPIGKLTPTQVEQAAEMAVANARELLAEADLLRAKGSAARAFFLAHIACEEVGKLPILITAAVSDEMGIGVDWNRIDRVLRSHTAKIKQVLFMDSIVAGQDLATGTAEYDADLKRMRTYTDMKNASLYSSLVDGNFRRPNELISGEFFDTFRPLAHGRVDALEAMYLRPVRAGGGLPAMLARMKGRGIDRVMDVLAGPETRAVFQRAKATGDESEARAWLTGLIDSLVRGDLADESEAAPNS